MGIHHDYKSKRGERAMAKQQKRESITFKKDKYKQRKIKNDKER